MDVELKGSPLDGKYGDVLLPFVVQMEHELHANAGKGDRPGWLAMRPEIALLEIYYHLAKLQKAVKDDNGAGIIEYSADVANMSMMLLDICGGLENIDTNNRHGAGDADAARYRWLRLHVTDRFMRNNEHEPCLLLPHNVDYLSPDEIDAAIDAARAGERGHTPDCRSHDDDSVCDCGIREPSKPPTSES